MTTNEQVARFIEDRASALEQRGTTVAPWVVLRAVASDVRAGLHEGEASDDEGEEEGEELDPDILRENRDEMRRLAKEDGL